MNINLDKFDHEEREIYNGFSNIKVDTERLMMRIKEQMPTEDQSSKRRLEKKMRIKKMIPLVAAMVTILTLSTTAFAALVGFDWFVERIDPPFAEVVEPVMMYSEDQGIRMTVLGAQTFDNMAIVYLSLQDVSGEDRLTESVNVSGGLNIQMNEDTIVEDGDIRVRFGSAGAQLIYFDEATGTAYFEARFVSHETIPAPLVFDTTHITFSWSIFEYEPIPISLAELAAPETITISRSEVSSSHRFDVDAGMQVQLLHPGRFASIPYYPDNTWISNVGIVDGQLRVQTLQDMSSIFGGSGVALALICPDGETIHPAETLWAWADDDYNPISIDVAFSEDNMMTRHSLSEHIFDVNINHLADYTLIFWGDVSEGVYGSWQIAVNTGDTANQIITVTDEVLVIGHNIEFLTLNPLGMQARGSWTEQADTWRGGSGEHGEIVAYVETADGNIRLISGARGYSSTFADRYSNEILGGTFDLHWGAEFPLDVNAVTAIIIEGVRIPIR